MIVADYEGIVPAFPNSKILHIEPGTRCNLLCPGCARYKMHTRGIKLPPEDFSLDHFKKAVNEQSDISEIFWSNVYSDAIYSTTFIDILDHCNTLQHRPINRISSNGSGRNTAWWKKLAESLHDKDVFEFSIDGLEDTNPIYRVNSKWNTIMDGATTLINELDKQQKQTQVSWRFIVFEHNYHQIVEIYKLAKQMRFHNFKFLLGDKRTPPEMLLQSSTFEQVENTLEDYINANA